MKFEPKSKEEIDVKALLKPGVYMFEVRVAEEMVSKSGNEMIRVGLEITNIDDNKTSVMYDYLLEAFQKKLFEFCSATGLENKYYRGELKAKDCIGKTGRVEIILQQGRENPNGGYYHDSNSVRTYMSKIKEEKPKGSPMPNADFFDDDVPF